MDKFSTTVNVYEFPSAADFARDFQVGKDDLLFTHRFLYAAYFEPLDLGCPCVFYEDYAKGEPDEDAVDAMREALRGIEFRRLIAIGGGSILDSAKILCVKDARSTADIYEDRVLLVRDRELVLVPTTCGTGSEMDGIAVVYMKKQGAKIGKSGPGTFADASVLIPELLENLPYDIFMYSAIDALIHGIESYLSPLSHAFSNVYNAEAVRLIVRGFRKMRDDGRDARKQCLIDFARASAFAGIGLSHNPCGAIHACAMVFGGIHHTPHGMTNAIFMYSILRRYAGKKPDGAIAGLAKIICEELGIRSDAAGAFAALNRLITGLIKLDSLSKFGMESSASMEYAEKVIATQQRLIINSYIDIPAGELAEVFEELCR